MMYQDHLRTCGYCRNDLKAKKLAELWHMIRGTTGRPTPVNKVASSSSYSSSSSYTDPRYPKRYKVLNDKQRKLKELGRMVKGL